MNILIQIQDPSSDKEIVEFAENSGNQVFISRSTEESITRLSNQRFEKAFISMKNLRDASILKFLNDYYPGIQVIVLANKNFDEVISIFQKSNYSVIHEPLRLAELKKQFEREKTTLH